MSVDLFSEAMGELDDKYIMEAAIYEREKKPVWSIWTAKAAGFLLILLAGSIIFFTVNTEARAALLGWIREFYAGNYYRYSYEGEKENTTETKKRYQLGWVPEDYQLADTFEIEGGESCIFLDEDNNIMDFSYSTQPESLEMYIETADFEHQEIAVKGLSGDLYVARDSTQSSTMMLMDDESGTIFSISAPVSEEELIKIAESIEEKEPEPVSYVPGWLPDGSVFVTSYEIPEGEAYIYTNERDTLIQFSYSRDTDANLFIDGVDSEKQSVNINGCEGDIYITPTEEETNGIIWTDDDTHTIFFFSADCDAEGLIRFAENVQVKE